MNATGTRGLGGSWSWLSPQALLVAASLVVAAAILLAGGEAGRALSGIGGALWIAAAVWMLAGLRNEPRRAPVALVALAGAAVMAVIVRPGTYLEAIVGFGLAGAAVGVAAGPSALRWAMLPAALYFPLHIAVAIGRVIASGGERAVRTDPPPTAALVQVAMVAAAAAGGWLAWKALSGRESAGG
ncbi:MAG: hypothetical protein ACKOWF_03665 [Chloroflexota bacterium]